MTTPARKQYLGIKKQHQDAILLFRMGDFYETFDDDARTLSRVLEIALTSREMGGKQRIPLAGIPYHALDPYLARLIKKGYKVAICEQVGDPATSKGPVDRQVVRVVTPGTIIEDSLLDVKANNYLMSVVTDGDSVGVAYADITTSEFATSQFDAQELPVELARLSPAEVLVAEDQEPPTSSDGATITVVEPEMFHADWAPGNPARALWRRLPRALWVRSTATGGPSLGGHYPVHPQDPAGGPGPDHDATHLLHVVLHGAGPPDSQEPGALPGRQVEHRRRLAIQHSGPDQDGHGRSAAPPMDRTATAGPR